MWFLDDCVNAFERFFPEIATSNIISSSKKFIDKIDALYDAIDDCKYFRFLNSEKGIDKILNHYDLILDICKNNIEEFYLCYAQHCAEHIFHDRLLCAFVSESLVSIGFDGMDNPRDIEPKKWIERKKIPEWAKKSIRARDRGCCAICGKNLSGELNGKEEFDHIVPLAQAGTNDLANLQLTCSDCNGAKSANLSEVKTSIPPYFSKWKKNNISKNLS